MASSDWSLESDPSTGSPFYLNAITGETSWEDPTYNIDSQQAPTPSVNQTDIDGVYDVVEGNDNGDDSVETEEGGGREFGGNMLGLTKLKQQVASAPDTTALVISPHGEDDSSFLDDDPWQAVDDGSGNTYFHNVLTGESVWKEPEGYHPPEEGVMTQADGGAVATDDTAETDEGENGWQKMRDDSGRQYWYSEEDDKIQYTDPALDTGFVPPEVDDDEEFEEADFSQEVSSSLTNCLSQ